MEDPDFVKRHFSDLVSRLTSAMPIADKLVENNMLSWDVHKEISDEKLTKDKVRKLLNAVISGGPEVKSYFLKVLRNKEPFLVKDLEAKGRRQEAEAQGKPEESLIRWTQSSIKHKSKLEKFQKDPLKRKVGNLYIFHNSEDYFIDSGSSGINVYLGLKADGTEVAIKRIPKNPQNNKDFENELKHLQDLNLESKNLVKYVDFAENDNFYYLALQLCEYNLEGYMMDLRTQDKDEDKRAARKQIVKDMLLGLQVLHNAKVIHRDIKPKNVLIDAQKNARLADFGLSRKLEEGSTVYTERAGTRGWEAAETLDESGNSKYKTSSDVQVAGMLVYYILTDGKHAFDVKNSKDRETNIREGNYSLDDLPDIEAQDLIKRMINRNPAERPSIDEALQHPYFWDDDRKDAVLRKLGDREEVQNCQNISKLYNFTNSSEGGNLTFDEACERLQIRKRDVICKIVDGNLVKLQTLCEMVKKYSEEKTFSVWKTHLSEIWKDIDQKLPQDLLGLLRTLRNKLVHARTAFIENDMLNYRQDFYISLYDLAKALSWEY